MRRKVTENRVSTENELRDSRKERIREGEIQAEGWEGKHNDRQNE